MIYRKLNWIFFHSSSSSPLGESSLAAFYHCRIYFFISFNGGSRSIYDETWDEKLFLGFLIEFYEIKN